MNSADPLRHLAPGTVVISCDGYWVEAGPTPRYGRLLSKEELALAERRLWMTQLPLPLDCGTGNAIWWMDSGGTPWILNTGDDGA